ncbi:MAG: hypothetical protein ACI8RZ_008061 [Myxococcota bacterium]
MKFTAGMKTWITTQQAAIATLGGDAKVGRIRGVLSVVESKMHDFQQGKAVDLTTLPAAPTAATGTANTTTALPELIGAIRPLINALEGDIAGATAATGTTPEGSDYTTEDWNIRLGVPQHRTQSDNLSAPEATCNVTTLSMVLERLGVGREKIMAATEDRIKLKWIASQVAGKKMTAASAKKLKADLSLVDAEKNWDVDAEWKKRVKTYLDGVQSVSKGYQRIRGKSSVNTATRKDLAGEFKEDAQMEDVLDFLISMAGISRYSIVGAPSSTLKAIDGDKSSDIATTEKLSGGTKWETLRDKTRSTLEAGGAAALSFRHKGTRSTGTHIVSIQSVNDDGFVVDDPYGVIRSDYNPKKSDDAYWHKQEKTVKGKKTNVLSGSRSVQKNTKNGFDDWTADDAQTLQKNERKGETSTISKSIITKSVNYIQLFNRPGATAPTIGTVTGADTDTDTSTATDSTRTVAPVAPLRSSPRPIPRPTRRPERGGQTRRNRR